MENVMKKVLVSLIAVMMVIATISEVEAGCCKGGKSSRGGLFSRLFNRERSRSKTVTFQEPPTNYQQVVQSFPVQQYETLSAVTGTVSRDPFQPSYQGGRVVCGPNGCKIVR
jgi:hypothetical protein